MRALLSSMIVCICFSRAIAGGGDIVINPWEVLYDQTPTVQEASMRGEWEKVSPPLIFKLPYDLKWDYQFLWLRSSFLIEGDPARYFGVTLGNAYLVNTVYINGHMVGELSPEDCRIVHNSVHYEIQPGILKKGPNEIYIRLGTYDTEYARIIGNIAIMDRERYIRTVTIKELLHLSYPLGLIMFIAALFIFTIIIYVWDRSELIFMHSAVLFVILAVSLIFMFLPYIPIQCDSRIHINYGIYPIICLISLFVLQSIFGMYYQRINTTAIPFLFVLVLIIWILRFTHASQAIPKILNLGVCLITIPIILYIIIRTYRLKHERFVLLISVICFLIPILMGSAEVATMMLFRRPPPKIYFYLSPMLLVGMVIFNIRKIMHRKIQLKSLYRDFQLSLKSSDKKTVTTATEGKIAEIIQFLRENYRADISREGLASAVDLSPDHLSRMFKASTGKRIIDFINELRVQEAARLLVTTELKIADIASSVGFESLTTFNRNFMKVMGTHPVDYRK